MDKLITFEAAKLITLERPKRGQTTNSPAYIYIYIYRSLSLQSWSRLSSHNAMLKCRRRTTLSCHLGCANTKSSSHPAPYETLPECTLLLQEDSLHQLNDPPMQILTFYTHGTILLQKDGHKHNCLLAPASVQWKAGSHSAGKVTRC